MLIQFFLSLKERLQKLFVIIIILEILMRVTCQIYYRQCFVFILFAEAAVHRFFLVALKNFASY